MIRIVFNGPPEPEEETQEETAEKDRLREALQERTYREGGVAR